MDFNCKSRTVARYLNARTCQALAHDPFAPCSPAPPCFGFGSSADSLRTKSRLSRMIPRGHVGVSNRLSRLEARSAPIEALCGQAEEAPKALSTMSRTAKGNVIYVPPKDGKPGRWKGRVTAIDGTRPWIDPLGDWPNSKQGRARAEETIAHWAEELRAQRLGAPRRLTKREARGLSSLSTDRSRVRVHVSPPRRTARAASFRTRTRTKRPSTACRRRKISRRRCAHTSSEQA